MHARFIATTQFSAFGQDYLPGAEVLPEHIAEWPEGTLATRIERGFIRTEVVRDESEQAATDDTAQAEAALAAAKAAQAEQEAAAAKEAASVEGSSKKGK